MDVEPCAPAEDQLLAMAPHERMQAIGNFLYPLIAAMPECVDASKVTGMLLDGLPEEQLLAMLPSPAARAECVGQAVASLKQHAVAQLGQALAFCEDGQDIPGIPWAAELDGLATSEIPVERDMPVCVLLRAPLDLPYVVHIWIQPSGGAPMLAGTLSADSSRFDMVLSKGSVRIHASLALPNALPGLTIAVESPVDTIASPSAPRTPVTAFRQSSALTETDSNCWADEDEDDDPLPSVADLRQKIDARRQQRAQDPLVERLLEFRSEYFDYAYWCGQPPEQVGAFILEKLEEQRAMIVRAAVDALGVPIALYLLHRTTTIQAEGGMTIEPEGRPRTSGGVFLKLLRESTELPEEEAREAVRRIKQDDSERRQKHQKKRNNLKKSQAGDKSSPGEQRPLSPWSPRSGAATHRKEAVLSSPLAMGETGLSLLLESES